MNVFNLATRLTRDLGGDFVVAPSPDHPELASGPDILIGGRGRITAVFRIARTSTRRLLHARVIATRLAFPAASRLVALVENDAEPPPVLANQGFDTMLRAKDTQELIRVISSDLPERHRISELQNIQKQHAIFYSTILQIAELRSRHTFPQRSVHEVIATLQVRHDQFLPSIPKPDLRGEHPKSKTAHGSTRSKINRESWRATVLQTTVAELRESKTTSATKRFRPLWSEALSKDFVLDRGIPYQQSIEPRILLIETWPTHKTDPQKPTRVAAFSSWLMAVATTAQDVETLIERTQEAVKKGLYA